METRENADGKKVAHVAAEFSLGDAAPSLKKKNASPPDDDALIIRAETDGWDKARVEVEYDGGTTCDIDEDTAGNRRRRATTARLICGDTNALVSVVEDRTCHYVFTVTTPALCKHAAFITAPNARPVTCERVDDTWDRTMGDPT